VLILLTNDDGVHAPGLGAMERQLRELGDVCVVAPATEQSGVGHSITYLTPLTAKEVYVGRRQVGRGRLRASPADCVKLGVTELCPGCPDLVVSGINGGLNAGINVLYSGTVAAAIEGAFFGITSVAVSLEFDEHADFDKAARMASTIIRQILDQKGAEPELYNLNIPTLALENGGEVCTVPMDVTPYDEQYEKRIDPFGRPYYWATGYPPPAKKNAKTDLAAIAEGFVTLTPLDYNMSKRTVLEKMESWRFRLDDSTLAEVSQSESGRHPPVVKTTRRKQTTESDAPGSVPG